MFSIFFIGLVLWFLKFPTYRYGSSYVVGSIIFSQFYLFKKFNLKNYLKKIFQFMIFIIAAIITIKYLGKYNEKKLFGQIYIRLNQIFKNLINLKKILRKKYFILSYWRWKTLYVFTFSMHKYFCSRKTGSQNYKWLQGLFFRE